MHMLDQLLARIFEEARREDFPVDSAAYTEAGRDPLRPILFGGTLGAAIGFFGRDLGRQEVLVGEPLIGPAGQLVRGGLAAAGGQAALLTNTVPYKPPSNKAYPVRVVRRFRPFIAELLVSPWRGDRLITLGNKAFEWFKPYDPALMRFWADAARRYTDELPVEVTAGSASRTIRLAPLPHPSPLNVRWYRRFPELLAARLGGE